MKLIILILSLLITSCAARQISSNTDHLKSQEYQGRKVLSNSFFKKSENNFNDSQIKKLLNSRLKISSSVKLAIIKLGHTGVNYNHYYGQGDTYSDEMSINKNNQEQLSNIVKRSNRVKDLSIVPSFLLPTEVSIANLRDTAALMQANYLIIIKTNSSTDFNYNLFSKNEAVAIANMEVGVVDVLSGAIPFTSLVTGNVKIKKNNDEDFNSREFQVRARTVAESEAYEVLSKTLVDLFNSKSL